LSRRSIDVHFPRYRAESAPDRKAFMSVLNSFAQQLPIPDPPDLANNWEFLYERSIWLCWSAEAVACSSTVGGAEDG